MAPHSSTLAWKIPWTEEPGGLQSMGSWRVGHDWVTSLSCIGEGNGNPLQYSCLENPSDGEPAGLLSVGSHRVGHDGSDLAAAALSSVKQGICLDWLQKCLHCKLYVCLYFVFFWYILYTVKYTILRVKLGLDKCINSCNQQLLITWESSIEPLSRQVPLPIGTMDEFCPVFSFT